MVRPLSELSSPATSQGLPGDQTENADATLGNAPAKPAVGEEFLKLCNITKRWGAITALEDVNLEIRRGEVLGLLGDNGLERRRW